jgi:hypothetical protein
LPTPATRRRADRPRREQAASHGASSLTLRVQAPLLPVR